MSEGDRDPLVPTAIVAAACLAVVAAVLALAWLLTGIK